MPITTLSSLFIVIFPLLVVSQPIVLYPFEEKAANTSLELLESLQSPSAQMEALSLGNYTLPPQTTITTAPPNSLPLEYMQISTRSRNEVVAYSILFVVAATGNLTVFFSVCHQLSKLKWRITVLMLHLSIADLIVTFFLMPLEIFWRLTIQWVGGEVLCKGCQFFRAFGLYLSSNILICISLDRFIAILFPLRMVGATRRVKAMIAVAWLAAALSAAPQCVVFSVQAHPLYPSFKQCVSFGFFSTPTQEIVYNVFSVSAMYFIPLIVTIFTYSMILWKISSKSHVLLKQQTRGSQEPRGAQRKYSINYAQNQKRTSLSNGYSVHYNGQGQNSNPYTAYTQHNQNTQLLVSSSNSPSESANLLARAKKRTLRMTFVIVIVFVCCWSPYAIMHLWYTFDKESAKRLVDASIQDILFMMAVANSCLNPIVYGNYTKKTAGPLLNCGWQWISCCISSSKANPDAGRAANRNNRRRMSTEDPKPQQRTSSFVAITSVI